MAFSESYGRGYLSIHVNKQAVAGAAGAGIGVIQAVGLQNMDAQGQLGAPWIPQLGPFGTVSGVVNTATGAVGLGLGLLGAFGHGPMKRHATLQCASMAYGVTTLLAQGTAAVLNTSAVRAPYAVVAARSFGAGAATASPASIASISSTQAQAKTEALFGA